MRITEAELRQIIKEVLEHDEQVSLDTVRSAVTNYVMKNVTLPIPVRDALRAILRGEAAGDVIRGVGGAMSQSFYENILPPEPQGYDDFVYRGLRIKTENLSLLGIDPSSLPIGHWIDLTKGEHLGGATEEESDLDPDDIDPDYDDEEEESVALPLIPIPNPPDKTVSSWSYDKEVAKTFAGEGRDGVAAVILRAPIGRPNGSKFLQLFGLYRLFGMRHTDELEVLGIAGDRQPIMACVSDVKLG
jgi:hypothetical protein